MNDVSNDGADQKSAEVKPKKPSELKVRLLSAIVMALLAGFMLWAGGTFFAIFVVLIAIGIFLEWKKITKSFSVNKVKTNIWLGVGVFYIGFACFTLIFFRLKDTSYIPTLMFLLVVVATDVGAYFSGRAIGGKKLMPSVSPGKTWAGLGGAMIAAGFVWALYSHLNNSQIWYIAFIAGVLMAILAQMGDLFESWMKRKADMKDSGNMIPGHGGLFDRTDGILAVFFVLGLLHIPLFWNNITG